MALHLAPSLSGAQRDTISIRFGGMNGMFDLSARVQVDFHSSYVDSLSTQRGWLQLVILWRGETDWRSRASQDSTPTTGAEREFDRRATNAGTAGGIWSGSQVGTLVYGAIHDRQGKWIEILGRRFMVPENDSALIILVDHVDGVGGDPTIVAVDHVPSRLPVEVLPVFRSSSADTMPSSRSRITRQNAIRTLLDRSKVVREFLR